MGRLELSLLGGFRASLANSPPLVLPRKKTQALLAILASRPDHPHARDALIGLLWSDSREDQARHGLRQALYETRRALCVVRPSPLVLRGDTVALRPGAIDVDVITFQRLVRDATPPALLRAVTLYAGDFLLGGLLAHQIATDAVERAVHTALRLLALDPLQEATHRTLMRLYVRQGRFAAALRQYQLCADVLRRELGAETPIRMQVTSCAQRSTARPDLPASAGAPARTAPSSGSRTVSEYTGGVSPSSG